MTSPIMEMPVYELLTAFVVVFLGAIVQGTIGFGMAIVAAPVLYIVSPSLVPSTLIAVSLLLSLQMLRKYWGNLELSKMKYAVLGRIPGSMMGAWLLTVASREHMSLFMGVTVLFAVAVSAFKFNLQATKSTLMAAGVVSGITGTTSSIGGPPIALVIQNESGDSIRANMAVYFVFSSCISLVFLYFGGLFGGSDLVNAVLLQPAVIMGGWVAGLISRQVNQQFMKMALLVMCSVAGFTAIATGLSIA